MTIMESDKCCIGELIRVLVEPVRFIERLCIFINLSLNPDLVTDRFCKGNVDEYFLLELLKKSIHSRKIQVFLPDILFLVDADSVTDAVVNFCVGYPGEFRSTLLGVLAHMWLKVDQLELINANIETPEAFCKLFAIYAQNCHCSESDFYGFLSKNKRHFINVDCAALVRNWDIKISEKKQQILDRFELD